MILFVAADSGRNITRVTDNQTIKIKHFKLFMTNLVLLWAPQNLSEVTRLPAAYIR
jgi:hypothetical protein